MGIYRAKGCMTAAAMVLAMTGAGHTDEARAGEPPRLALPVACDLHRDCFIQSYADQDPGAGVLDFACGSATYNGHDGTDFRLLSAEAARAGVAVLAASAGTVKAVRDGMPDTFADAERRVAISGRECGNGVVIDHGGGWETQYCHMRQGSLAVETGVRVERGQKLGEVGYSGLAQFAHLHLTVRRDGLAMDPFTGARLPTASGSAACTRDAAAAEGLWDDAFRAAYRYQPSEIIEAGFAGAVPKLADAETDGAARAVDAASPQLVFFARLINLRTGDRLRFDVKGPGGFEVTNTTEPLDRNKAHYLAFVGKKLKAPRWPAGNYDGKVEVVREGTVVATTTGAWVVE